MITIASFSKPEEAHLLRLRLEAGGISAYIHDENTIQLNWLYSDAMGGVKVQIADTDFADAQSILNGGAIDPGGLENRPCPCCLSPNTEMYDLPRRIFFISILVVGFPVFVTRNKWCCPKCNHKWK